MTTLNNEISPADAGIDPTRLARLNAHFERYVDDGRLPGFHFVVARHGKVAHQHRYGMRDLESALPVEADTIYRIYSMTKPITSIALMMLVEEGKLQLNDPVSKFIPSFGDSRV
ncbi:MAG: class A beta-lactamase-related serine hydrolase, partial [Actinobacteria bacterium]|nr:class A beta-lactamase-related serine hydrolase [Actinomycetota bacterium]